jgi:hypothetical protein
MLKLFLGLAPAASDPQQSNECGLGGFAGGLEQTERPRVAQGFLRLVAFETLHQRGQKPRAKLSGLLTLAGAPDLKFMAVRQIEAFEEATLERFRRLAQGIGRHGIGAVSGNAAQRQDVDGDMIEIQTDILAVGNDPSTVRFIDERPQAGQTPAQGCSGIVREGPEHGTESVAAVGTPGDCQIGQQRPSLF